MIRSFWLSLVLLSLPTSLLAGAPVVKVGCDVWVGDQLAFHANEFAHQPYVIPIEGKDREGDPRHYRFGVSFNKGNFTASISDYDHQIDHDGYSTALALAKASVKLSAPNELDFSAGDSSTDDPQVQVKCTLTPPDNAK
jgi:hypothetical protein